MDPTISIQFNSTKVFCLSLELLDYCTNIVVSMSDTARHASINIYLKDVE